jgi:hypothetical protein
MMQCSLLASVAVVTRRKPISLSRTAVGHSTRCSSWIQRTLPVRTLTHPSSKQCLLAPPSARQCLQSQAWQGDPRVSYRVVCRQEESVVTVTPCSGGIGSQETQGTRGRARTTEESMGCWRSTLPVVILVFDPLILTFIPSSVVQLAQEMFLLFRIGCPISRSKRV